MQISLDAWIKSGSYERCEYEEGAGLCREAARVSSLNDGVLGRCAVVARSLGAAAVLGIPLRRAWNCNALRAPLNRRTRGASSMTSATRVMHGLHRCVQGTQLGAPYAKLCRTPQGSLSWAAPHLVQRLTPTFPSARGHCLCGVGRTRLDFLSMQRGYARMPQPGIPAARQCASQAGQSRLLRQPGGNRLWCSACRTGSEVGPARQSAAAAWRPVPAAEALPSLPSAVYVHLPFCRRRCHYCDFAIVPIGNLTDGHAVVSRMEHYLHHLKREIAATATALGAGPSQVGDRGPALSTVYFGGGTPSLIPPRLLDDVMRLLDTLFGIQPTAEVSMEVDPGTFDAAKLQGFRDVGINRVSLGVQAFQEKLLKACGRAHNVEDVYRAVDLVHASGLDNWSLDLMASLPHQTPEDWHHSLAEAIASGAPHISVYDLQVEDGTPFGRWYTPGASPLPSDEAAADMYRLASRMLQEAGFNHYEISNYARAGFESRHNLVYWHAQQYLAFGMGAASYLGGTRLSRPRGLADYAQWVAGLEETGGAGVLFRAGSKEGPDHGASAPSGTMTGGQQLAGLDGDATEKLLETAMLRLRLAAGLDMGELEAEFGQEAAATLIRAMQPYVDSGHVSLALSGNGAGAMGAGPHSGQRTHGPAVVRLSDPEGFLVSNEIISSIFAAFP